MQANPRYFRNGEEVWKFAQQHRPKLRTPDRQEWVEGTVLNLAEFLMVNPDAVEISSIAGELPGIHFTRLLAIPRHTALRPDVHDAGTKTR